MRVATCLFTAAGLFSASLSWADDASNTPPNPVAPVTGVISAVTDTPDGWTRNMDGSYRQAESGVLCPSDFKTFHLNGVTGPSKDQPNIIGDCRYGDGNGRYGSIRIRKYLQGWGSDQSLASNDTSLMATDGSAPPMLMRASVDHKTANARLTVTAVRSGFLVDCSVAQLGHDRPPGDFPLYCTTISAAP